MLAKLVLFVLLCLAVYALFRGGKKIFHIYKSTVVVAMFSVKTAIFRFSTFLQKIIISAWIQDIRASSTFFCK